MRYRRRWHRPCCTSTICLMLSLVVFSLEKNISSSYVIFLCLVMCQIDFVCMQWLCILQFFTVSNVEVQCQWSLVFYPHCLQVIVSLAGMDKIISFDNVSPTSFVWLQYLAFCNILIISLFKCIQWSREILEYLQIEGAKF